MRRTAIRACLLVLFAVGMGALLGADGWVRPAPPMEAIAARYHLRNRSTSFFQRARPPARPIAPIEILEPRPPALPPAQPAAQPQAAPGFNGQPATKGA